jgi:hypothetical protein
MSARCRYQTGVSSKQNEPFNRHSIALVINCNTNLSFGIQQFSTNVRRLRMSCYEVNCMSGIREHRFTRTALVFRRFSIKVLYSVNSLSKNFRYQWGIFTQCHWPPLWSIGQSFWLQIQRSRVRFLALPDFLRSDGSGSVSIQPREYNGEAKTKLN